MLILRSLFFAILLLASTSFAGYCHSPISDQDDHKTNQKDEQGRKQGIWIFFGKDMPERGYPMEGKISEGPFKNDRKEGRWIIYYKDGKTPKMEGDYINNRPNGSFIKYHPNGKIEEVGFFNARYYTDSLIRYNQEGILVYSCSYNEVGEETGNVEYYYDNGKPEFIYQAKDGHPVGEATRYWANGDVKEKLTFDENGDVKETSGIIERVNPKVVVKKPGKTNEKLPPRPTNVDGNFNPNSYNKVYNSNLELWMDGDFKNGRLYDGRLYVYDEDGLLLKVEVYKNGKYHSDGQI